MTNPPLSAGMSPDQFSQIVGLIGQALIAAGNAILGNGHSANLSTPARVPVFDAPIIMEAVNEFLLAKARSGRSDRYLRQLKVCMKNFGAGRSRIPITSVTTQDVESWMLSQKWSSRTCRGYVKDIQTFFNFAIRRGYVTFNPANGVELPVLEGTAPIGVHTPEEVRTVLNTARHADIDVCRHLAVRYFAGIRSAEAHRLRETDLKIDQELIEVPAVKSKTRARRLVTIQPNLRAWLDLGGELRPIGDMTVRSVIRLSKVPWPRNATRHSFVSYHLAKFGNAGKTALEAGHSEAMTFAHYRAVVTPTAAAEFWGIFPRVASE